MNTIRTSLFTAVIGDGKVGPVTRLLQERYFEHVRGTRLDHPEWLTLVGGLRAPRAQV